MEEFKILKRRHLRRLSDEERKEYQLKALEHYGNLKNQLDNFEKMTIIHNIIWIFMNLYPIKIHKLNDINIKDIDGPIIFTANHSNANDFPILFRLIKKHFFIMADYSMQNDFFVDTLNKINGCVYVDRKSKESGKNAFEQAIEGVKKGYNMLIFPESTWNLFPKRPMLPRHWGDLKIAQETGRPILPIALVYSGRNCFVKYGKLRYVNKADDLKTIDREVYDEMCDLRLDIWNSKIYKTLEEPITYDEWLTKTIKSYNNFDVEYEMSAIRDDGTIDYSELEYILNKGEQLRPTNEIEEELNDSKVNYRLR